MKDKLVFLSLVPVLFFSADLKEDGFLKPRSYLTKSVNTKIKNDKDDCLSHGVKNQYIHLLHNKIKDYYKISSHEGIIPCSNYRQILSHYKRGKLHLVKNNHGFKLDDLTYSYPFLIPCANRLLEDIGMRFDEAIKNTPLQGSKFIVTSLTRTTHSVKRLRKNNINSIQRSPHLNGNSMDFSFSRFEIIKESQITPCDKQFLQATLSKVLYDLKINGKCWVTFEKYENCLHVVANKINL
ncbi:MAG: hypothetical protein FJZ66_00620 [Bacteroidetes bacterium]|nr:hypothetical protein [Bacteroidota bacterium]